MNINDQTSSTLRPCKQHQMVPSLLSQAIFNQDQESYCYAFSTLNNHCRKYFKFDGCTWWESQSSVGTEQLAPAGFTPLSLFLPMSKDRAPLNRLLKYNRREAGRWKLYSGQGSLFNNSPTELDNASDKSTPLPKMLRSESVEQKASLRSFCTFSASFSCSCLCNGLYNHTSVNPDTF